MGLIRHAIYRSASQYAAADRAYRRSKIQAEHRNRQAQAAAPLFYADPSRRQVAEYLDMKIRSSRSPDRIAALRIQLADIRAGAPYTVRASAETGRITIRIL